MPTPSPNSGPSSPLVLSENKKKVRIHIYLRKDLIEKIKSFGFSISGFVQIAVIEKLNSIENNNIEEKEENHNNNNKTMRRPGFEPGPAAWQAAVLPG